MAILPAPILYDTLINSPLVAFRFLPLWREMRRRAVGQQPPQNWDQRHRRSSGSISNQRH
jgi:hypothetical protein